MIRCVEQQIVHGLEGRIEVLRPATRRFPRREPQEAPSSSATGGNGAPDVRDAWQLDGAAPLYAGRLMVKENDGIRFISVDEIQFVESERNYLRIHTEDAEYVVRRRIGELETQLDPKHFMRIHRSTIVNLDFVDRLVPWFSGGYLVHLHSGEELKLSRGYANKLFDQVGKTL